MIKNHILAAAVSAAVILPGAAMATNGYFWHGYGTKSEGMGGVGIALPQDAVVGNAANPAGLGFVGDRVDFGLEMFIPQRETKISGNDITGFPTGAPPPFDKIPPQFGGMNNGKFNGDNDSVFWIPNFGVNYWINDNMALGFAVVGTGGMNTNYSGMSLMSGTPDPSEETGIQLEQVKFLPALAYKINENHSIGASLQIVGQRFKSFGLGSFTREGGPMAGQVSAYPDKLSDKGHDLSWGVGLSVGWTGKITDAITLGAVYNSKVNMGEFDDYKGLFAEKGDFDLPENYGIGIAWQATSRMQLAFDVSQINYGDVRAVNNQLQSGNGGMDMFNPNNYLGTKHGSGFGWDDMTVYKLGADYDISDNWTIRAGWNHADQPVDKDQTMFNILAPAVVEDHLTLGATYNLDSGSELSFYYMHAFENKVKGSNSIPAAFGGGEADIEMSQDAFGISYGFNF